MIKLTLPFPPSANRYWRHGRGRTFLSQAAKDYRKAITAIGVAQKIKPLDGPVCLTAHVYRPAKRGDLMNREKILSDSLEGIAYHNDKQIVECHFHQADDKHNPRVEVEVVSVEQRLF